MTEQEHPVYVDDSTAFTLQYSEAEGRWVVLWGPVPEKDAEDPCSDEYLESIG